MENPEFLKAKYNLHTTPEVESAARRTEKRIGDKVPQNPADRIQNYLDRFKEIVDKADPAEREQGMEALKKVLHDQLIIKPEEVPESYFANQQRLAREQGHGDVEVTQEAREQLTEVVLDDQQSTLDTWVDYLTSKDASYPDWLKYWSFRSVTALGSYDKEQHQFPKRSRGTTSPFPDLNREALAYVLDAVEKKYHKQNIDLAALPEAERAEFTKLLQVENFGKLYAWAIEKVTPASQEALANTRGEWVKYYQGTDHMPLVKSLQGHGTNWCTAGESTAERQLEAGDFYVYYSVDEHGQPIVPRAAIRMQEGRIAEVRGVAGKDQNMDAYITPVVEQKLKEFPDGKEYAKKTSDMKLLTALERKTKQGEALTKDELTFLYELNSPIEGFGYERDPRIKELLEQRNPEADMPMVFECAPEQIAHNLSEIRQGTKAYVGKLEPGIFDQIQEHDIKHLYTSFPESRIRRFDLEIGGKTEETLKTELRKRGIDISLPASLKIKAFTTLKNPEKIALVRLKVRDLGFEGDATNDEICSRAEEFGLERCPSEVGVHYLLADLPLRENSNSWILIKNPITGRAGGPDLLRLANTLNGPSLNGPTESSKIDWESDEEFIFRLRPVKSAEAVHGVSKEHK